MARLVAEVPALRWVVEERTSLAALREKINSLARSVETILEEEWANDIHALEKERVKFAPELTPDEARSLYFSKRSSGAIFRDARELPEDDGLILAVGLTIYIFEKKDRLLREEYRRLATEFNQRLVTLLEEVKRQRALGGEWLQRLDELVEERNRYERFSERQIGSKITSAGRLLGQAYYSVCSSITYYRLEEALAGGQFQREPGEVWPTKILEGWSAKGVFQIKPAEQPGGAAAEAGHELARSMFERCKNLSDLDADVLDALFAFWQLQARSGQDDGVAAVDHILKLRNVWPKLGGQSRRGGFDRKQRAEVIASIARLESVWVSASQLVKNGHAGRPRYERLQSYLIVVSEWVKRGRARGQSDVRFVIFQPGEAFKGFLLGPGRQVALLAAQTLKYNWRTHALEKRMSRYLSWQWRIRARREDYVQPYKVQTLLDAVQLSVDERNPSRTIERFESVLERLKEDGVVEYWSYRTLDDVVINRKKGWVNTWRDTLVEVGPPTAVRQHYSEHLKSGKRSDPKWT